MYLSIALEQQRGVAISRVSDFMSIKVLTNVLNRLLSDVNNSVYVSTENISNILKSIINSLVTERNDEYCKSWAEVMSKVCPNDVGANVLTEELKIFV